MSDITEKLRPHVAAIQEDVKGGDLELRRHAAAIINLHCMHVDCPGDPGAPALCEAAFNEWKKAKGLAA